MKKSVFSLMLIFSVVNAFSVETLKLNNGNIIIFDNQLPEKIRAYYNGIDLLGFLNNKNDSFEDLPFSCSIKLGYSDQDGQIYCYVNIPNIDLEKSKLSLVLLETSEYINFIHLNQFLKVIIWWIKDIPFHSEGFDEKIALNLNRAPIDMYCDIINNNTKLGVTFTFSKDNRGYPNFQLRYPITVNGIEVNPNVQYLDDLSQYLIVSRYPIKIRDQITDKITTSGMVISNFFK